MKDELPAASAVLIAGVVRDGGRQLEDEVARIDAAFECFPIRHWFIVESDSSDDTVARLRGLVDRVGNFRYTSLGTLSEAIPSRTERIAHCRNAYLTELRNDARYRTLSHVAVVDLDVNNDLLVPRSVRSCFEHTDWDVLTANQRGPYYDIWALRHEAWSPNDCWAQHEFLSRFDPDAERVLNAAVNSRMIQIPEDADPIPVISAFGGLALYRRSALLSGCYAGRTAAGRSVCEHVPLHEALAARGCRMFINPRLINTGWHEHARALRGSQKLRRRLGRAKRALAGLGAPLNPS